VCGIKSMLKSIMIQLHNSWAHQSEGIERRLRIVSNVF